MTKLTYTALVLAAILSISVSVIFANQINAQQQNGYITDSENMRSRIE